MTEKRKTGHINTNIIVPITVLILGSILKTIKVTVIKLVKRIPLILVNIPESILTNININSLYIL
jgi:hypothetical protein